MEVDIKIIFNYLVSIILLFAIIGCSSLISLSEQDINSSNKYFIGRANTENFQQTIKEVLLDFDYHIEEYDNGPTSSYIVTSWKIREPYTDESNAGFEEAKTRLIIKGMIDNQSFERHNGFSYECFLEVRNFVYNGEEFVPYYGDEQLNDEILLMVKNFSNALVIDG